MHVRRRVLATRGYGSKRGGTDDVSIFMNSPDDVGNGSRANLQYSTVFDILYFGVENVPEAERFFLSL